MISGTTTAGSYNTPPNTGDAAWSSGIGAGGTSGNAGGHGRIVISYP